MPDRLAMASGLRSRARIWAIARAMSLRAVVVGFALAVVVACGGEKKESRPPPEKPFTGAPVAVVVDKVGEDSIDVSIYNFADKPVAMYWFLIRFKDKDGKVLKYKPGTPFEDDNTFTTMSGNKYKTNAKSWSHFEIDMLEIPEGTASAEVLVRSVHAIAKDNLTIEQDPLWEMQDNEWPAGH